MVNGLNESSVGINEITRCLSKLVIANGNSYWLNKLKHDKEAVIHLAVMVQPYLSRILAGEKTIESRYSVNLITPYKKIKTGDVVLLKKSGGGVVAVFEAGKVRYFSLCNQGDIEKIKQQYNDRLKIDEDFWEEKKNSKYATLIDINELLQLPQFYVRKQSRTAWMTLGAISSQEEEAIQMKLENYPHVICIAGEIASGKTYVSKKIADRNNWSRCSTGDYLRHILFSNGEIDPPREQLQEIGKSEIRKGWNIFARDFLDYAMLEKDREFLVIDGIRHIEFFNKIKDIVFPKKCYLIYLNIPNETLHKRRIERGETNIDLNHIAEGDQMSLFNAADYISNGDIDDIEKYIKVCFNLN